MSAIRGLEIKTFYSAEYETEDGERFHTRWVEELTDVVDLVAEKGGTIRSTYKKHDGKIYRNFGGQVIDLHAKHNERVNNGEEETVQGLSDERGDNAA